jgi:hypothetical protein
MSKLLAASLGLVLGAEVLALLLPDRRVVLAISGAAVAIAFLAFRWLLVRGIDAAPAEPPTHDPGDSLRRWLSRTETLISWADSSRSDWDRHLRPLLARQFALATGQRQAKDPAAFQATGRMMFGADLWRWVDPENVVRQSNREPGPGRAALDAILQRLEQV